MHSFIKQELLQTFKNRDRRTQVNLAEIVAVFRRKYVKKSIATAKHTFKKLVFNPANQKLVVFLDEFQKPAKDALGITAHAIIEIFLYAKMPTHRNTSKNQADLKNSTYEQNVKNLE